MAINLNRRKRGEFSSLPSKPVNTTWSSGVLRRVLEGMRFDLLAEHELAAVGLRTNRTRAERKLVRIEARLGKVVAWIAQVDRGLEPEARAAVQVALRDVVRP